ncbi:MAG: adenosylcobinamide-GDP ribazoletransferase [Clostridia bacterium]|jgi:adenosylcobinamide-GDP ribazoletransferase|nr:adenosylcobinamide-GDP ribazoletransferase [Clostridia bacterium]
MQGLIIALQFMTRIPLKINLNITEDEFGSSSKFFPLVGLIIGIILFFIIKLTQIILPPLVVGAIILISEIIITGGIHLDGYMDTMDGLLSARPKEQALEIMKDSRVGAHSVTALISLLILKFSIIVSLPANEVAIFILFMPVVGRWFMLYCLSFFPYARNQGLGKIFWQQTKRKHWYISSLFILIMFLIFLPYIYLLALTITFLITLTPALLISKYLNGHTGDTYGALNEMAQVIFIFICLIISRI